MDCQPTINQLLANYWQTVDRLSADCWQTVSRLSVYQYECSHSNVLFVQTMLSPILVHFGNINRRDLLHLSITCELQISRLKQALCFFTAVRHCSRAQRHSVQQHQKVTFVPCGWWITIHFTGFCISVVTQLSCGVGMFKCYCRVIYHV